MDKEVKRLQDYLDACKSKGEKECDGTSFPVTHSEMKKEVQVETQLIDPLYFLHQMEQNRGRCDYGLQETLRLGMGSIFSNMIYLFSGISFFPKFSKVI